MTTQNELLAAIEDAERALSRARALLGTGDDERPTDEVWARRMLSVLAEVEHRGGRVQGDELLEIGEAFGYRRRGMAGFYQDLIARDGDQAVLTDDGRERLERLRSRYEALTPPPVSHPFWRRALPEDPTSDPFYQFVMEDKPASGHPFRAEDAKRELYRTWT